MTPSSPDYGRPVDDFIKTLTHEMMNALHYEAREPPNRSPPLWIREGLAEYEGYYSTTPGNRAKVDWLIEYVYENEAFDDAFRIENATSNNLRNLSVRIPKGVLTCVTGIAGSGKSSLVAELIDTLRRRPAGAGGDGEVVVVDQRPVGRSSRSNPATYVGVFDPIRRAFAAANPCRPGSSVSTPRVRARNARAGASWRSSCRFSTTCAWTVRSVKAGGTGTTS